ncbi:methylated-DNA-protein-cysteine methyltransferase [Aeropyrum pernix]|uniref:Methylated-DNA-protein-cysteine methyltransferase n=2 Tax=Aeropyrum pernix TaxID=56636 RepID=A0A401H974_AERPX|nr:methylated-DNA-protein-cysteine methyltransferase [Aeropyrum pernix]
MGSERPCRGLQAGAGPLKRLVPTMSLATSSLIVYTLLHLIPPGKVTTYSSLARASGLSPRAVGRILARNPSPIAVPCHRVVRSDGSIGGYSMGGPRVKAALLKLEGVRLYCSRGSWRVHPEDIVDLSSILLDPPEGGAEALSTVKAD